MIGRRTGVQTYPPSYYEYICTVRPCDLFIIAPSTLKSLFVYRRSIARPQRPLTVPLANINFVCVVVSTVAVPRSAVSQVSVIAATLQYQHDPVPFLCRQRVDCATNMGWVGCCSPASDEELTPHRLRRLIWSCRYLTVRNQLYSGCCSYRYYASEETASVNRREIICASCKSIIQVATRTQEGRFYVELVQ